MGIDKEEDSLEGCFVMVEEYKLVSTIIENIKNENIISIITRDWHDFSTISGLYFSYESYNYEENYLLDK